MSYQERYTVRRFPIEGGRLGKIAYAFEEEVEGPVFPFFLDADFSTYEGFREFIDVLGLGSVAWYCPGKVKKHLDDKWGSVLAGHPVRPLKEKWLKQTWQEVGDRLTEEQAKVANLFSLKQQLQKEGKATAIDPGLRLGKTGGILPSPSPSQGPLFEPFGSLREATRVLEEQVRLEVEIDEAKILNMSSIVGSYDSPQGQPAHLALETPAAGFKGAFKYRWRYDSIVARCYAEIATLINEGKAIVTCQCCQKYFVPKRANEKYCQRGFYERLDKISGRKYEQLLTKQKLEYGEISEEAKELTRVAAGPEGVTKQAFGAEWISEVDLDKLNDPEYRSKKELVRSYREAIGALEEKHRAERRAFLERHTCKKIGRQKTFKDNFSDYSREYQRLWQRSKKAKGEYGEGSPEHLGAAEALARLKKSKKKFKPDGKED